MAKGETQGRWRGWVDTYLTYASTPPVDEAGFRVHAATQARFWARLVFSIIAGAGLLFWPTDWLLFRDAPALLSHFALLRVGIVGISTLALWLVVRHPFWARRPSALLGGVLTLGCAAAGLTLGDLGGLEQPWFFHCYGVVALTIVLAVPLRARALTVCFIVATWSCAFFLPYPENLRSPYVGSVLIFLVFVASFSIVVGHFIYHLARRTYFQERRLAEQADALAQEQAVSEALLLNVLPPRVAAELKAGRQPEAERFESVTVLFADIAGFTSLSHHLSAQAVVALLNQVFSAFDALSERHGVEKIKTLGDAYMAAAGLPERRGDHAEAVARMALEMMDVLGALPLPGGVHLGIRVGIATGPVVAGVIGTRRFIYDLWGDTVNVASRMESHGQVGRIQVSHGTYLALKERFTFEARGAIEVKGMGKMPTHFLVAGPSPQVTPTEVPP